MEEKIEIWKDIQQYEGRYQVSNMGRVKSLARIMIDSLGRETPIQEKILKPASNKGYLRIRLEGKHYYIHQLVAKAFIPNPKNFQEINHKDENKQNNCVNNLEWCSREYNNSYGTRARRIGQNNPDNFPVFIYDNNRNLVKICNTITEAAKFLNKSASYVRKRILEDYKKTEDKYVLVGRPDIREHKKIVMGLHKLFVRKSTDYGRSTHDTYQKYGLTSFLVRLEDKLNRARTLSTQSALVDDEKIEDTLLDMANYAILAVIELRGDRQDEEEY